MSLCTVSVNRGDKHDNTMLTLDDYEFQLFLHVLGIHIFIVRIDDQTCSSCSILKTLPYVAFYILKLITSYRGYKQFGIFFHSSTTTTYELYKKKSKKNTNFISCKENNKS